MWKLLSTTAVILALSSPTWAQTGEGPDVDTPGMNLEQRAQAGAAQDYEIDRSNYPFLGQMDERAWSSNALIGQQLQTAQGETIGQVEGVVFTPDDRIAGIIVDADGRPMVVDWYAVNVRPTDRVLIVDMTREQIGAAPEYAMTEDWREEKEAGLPDVAETQPGVIAGEGVETTPPASAPAGGTATGAPDGAAGTAGGTDQ